MVLKSKPLDLVRSDVPVDLVTKEDSVRINLNVPASVRQNWKIAAVNRKIPLGDLIVEAMTTYLESN